MLHAPIDMDHHVSIYYESFFVHSIYDENLIFALMLLHPVA